MASVSSPSSSGGTSESMKSSRGWDGGTSASACSFGTAALRGKVSMGRVSMVSSTLPPVWIGAFLIVQDGASIFSKKCDKVVPKAARL